MNGAFTFVPAEEGTEVNLRLRGLSNDVERFGISTLPCPRTGEVFDPFHVAHGERPYGTCDMEREECAVGDQSGKFGGLGGYTNSKAYVDHQLQLAGINGALGRGLFINDMKGNLTCANITSETKLTAAASFSGGNLTVLEFPEFEHSLVVISADATDKGPYTMLIKESNDCDSAILGSGECEGGMEGSDEALEKCKEGDLAKKHGKVFAPGWFAWGDKVKARRAEGKALVVTSSDGERVACVEVGSVTEEKAWNVDQGKSERELSEGAFIFGLVLAVLVGTSILIYAGRKAYMTIFQKQNTRRYAKLEPKQEREIEM